MTFPDLPNNISSQSTWEVGAKDDNAEGKWEDYGRMAKEWVMVD